MFSSNQLTNELSQVSHNRTEGSNSPLKLIIPIEAASTRDSFQLFYSLQFQRVKDLNDPIIIAVTLDSEDTINALHEIYKQYQENPATGILSIFCTPENPKTIFIETLQPQLVSSKFYSHIQNTNQISNHDFVANFINFSRLSFLNPQKEPHLARITNASFLNRLCSIISLNFTMKTCYVKIIPEINYEMMKEKEIFSMSQLKRKYGPLPLRMALFRKDLLPESCLENTVITIDKTQYPVTKWDNQNYTLDGFLLKEVPVNEIKSDYGLISYEESTFIDQLKEIPPTTNSNSTWTNFQLSDSIYSNATTPTANCTANSNHTTATSSCNERNNRCCCEIDGSNSSTPHSTSTGNSSATASKRFQTCRRRIVSIYTIWGQYTTVIRTILTNFTKSYFLPIRRNVTIQTE